MFIFEEDNFKFKYVSSVIELLEAEEGEITDEDSIERFSYTAAGM